jgi:hypothetical protein
VVPNNSAASILCEFRGCFFSGSIFPELAKCYLQLKPLVLDRLPIQCFAGDVALSLAATKRPTLALPLRYNFPNDEIARISFPKDLEDIRIFHYFRTDEIETGAVLTVRQIAVCRCQ